MTVKPGDIIFYPDDGKWKHHVFATLQQIGGELGAWTGIPMTHVAMISTETDLIVEMKWPRPKFRFFAEDMREKIVMRPMCGDVVKTRSIYNCYMDIDAHYSFLGMVLGKFGLSDCHRVCSGWIEAAYAKAGFPLWPDKDRLVSPTELITSRFLERVL